MTDYVEVRFDIEPCNETMTDVLAAILAERGFDSFVPDPSGLKAYIRQDQFAEESIDLAGEWPFDSALKSSWLVIPGKDWNEEWERNYFKPIVIDDRCVIHSSFHTDFPRCEYDIVIDPKMAFGTGHHATTSLIVKQLLDLNLENQKVIDMGTGTGILAILAAKRGARPVIAVEIDPPAYENSLENVVVNSCGDIDVRLGDVSAVSGESEVDLFIANINRNVILEDLQCYTKTLKSGGRIILSGFLTDDIPLCSAELSKKGFKDITSYTQGDWASLAAILYR